MLRKKDTSRQSRGWKLLFMGGIYLVATIFSIGLVMMFHMSDDAIVAAKVFWFPFLILGIPGLIFGIRDITHKEKRPENLGRFDEPQSGAN